MIKPIVLIDFDHTLLDWQQIPQDFESYQQAKTFILQQSNLDEFLYPDTYEFLQEISRKWTPALFSEGEVDYQKKKIDKTNVGKFIDSKHMFIFDEHQKVVGLKQLANQINVLALIDDNPQILDAAKTLAVPTIRLKRGKYQSAKTKFQPDFEVNSLAEITQRNILESINQPISAKSNIHLVGIKGVGMTSLAQLLIEKDVKVTGSDSLTEQITDEVLNRLKIPVSSFSTENINSSLDLVIFSGAYKQTQHPELIQAHKSQIYSITLAEAVAKLTTDRKLVAVCGVGGKTTTTAMLATIFDTLQTDYGWFSGVSHINGGRLASARLGTRSWFALEADEYAIAPPVVNRPKLALYQPQIIICTNLDYDHPDIYPNFEATLQMFAQFFNSLPENGLLLIKPNDLEKIKPYLSKKVRVESYGIDTNADWTLSAAEEPGSYKLTHKKEYIFPLKVLGAMNALNAAAAISASAQIGISIEAAIEGIGKFTGTKRRLETVADLNGILYLDDYGHHPSEIQVTLAAVKEAYPQRQVRVVFHPHTLSRTKALLEEFATAFTKADEVIVADIFASAREKDDQTISSADLVDGLIKQGLSATYLATFKQIIRYLKKSQRQGDLILTLGAGDIYKIHSQLIHED